MLQRTQSTQSQQHKQLIQKQNYSLSVRKGSKTLQFQLVITISQTRTETYTAVISSLKDVEGMEKQFTDFDKFKQYVTNAKHLVVNLDNKSISIIDVLDRNNKVVDIGEIVLKNTNQQIQWMRYIQRKCDKSTQLTGPDAKQMLKMLSQSMLTVLTDIKNIKQKQINQQDRLFHLEQQIINFKTTKSIRPDANSSTNMKENSGGGDSGWVDPQCFSYKHIVQNNNTITALAPAQIFGKVKLLGQSTFTAKFTHIGTYPVCIGLVDIQNKSMAALVGVRNLVYYQSNSGSFDGNIFKVGQGTGFRIGQPITVVVDFSLGKIQWYMGFTLRHQEKISILSNPKIRWVPFICLPNKDDCVTIINE